MAVEEQQITHESRINRDEPPIITIADMNKWFGEFHVLKDINMQVQEREVVVIIGPSGSGKSTLIRCINRLEEHQQGRIDVLGTELNDDIGNIDHIRRDVGMVFQLHNLLPSLTAEENVQVPMMELGLSRRERRQKARELLASVGLSGRERNRPPELSGGERQRVALARALANDPPILLADEPTGSLDSDAGARVLSLLEELRQTRGLTILLVTHDATLAGQILMRKEFRLLGEEDLCRSSS